jgi:CRISPR-associated protein Cmr1
MTTETDKRRVEAPGSLPKVGDPPGQVSKMYDIKLITPLVGGGVDPGENDPVTPIRVPEIRGHLRFWWRATRGAEFTSAKELRKREAAIWGNTKTPSAVTVRVAIKSATTPEKWAELVRETIPPKDGKPARTVWRLNLTQFGRTLPRYVMFPFEGESPKDNKPLKQPPFVTKSAEFQLTVSYKAGLEKDVEAALWAWTNFGGLGARTRRGCGALWCKELAPKDLDPQSLKEWMTNGLGSAAASQAREFPTVGKTILVKTAGDAEKAWKQAIELLQTFRQGPDVGRNPGSASNRPGRSRWPEADSVRGLTEHWAPAHKTSVTLGNPKQDPAFPRAEFGLPLIMHFKDDGVRDPRDYKILPPHATTDNDGRMGTPVIIRPILDQGKRAASLVTVLSTKPLEGVCLNLEGRFDNSRKKNGAVVRRPALASYPKSPLAGRSAAGSAVEGFVKYLTQSGFTEVSR